MGLEKKSYDLNIITGEFDVITEDNHSYEEINPNTTGRVRKKQQMVLHEELILEGNLVLDGSLVLEV